MKRLFFGLLLIGLWSIVYGLWSAPLFAQFSRRERREIPASWERSVYLTWAYHSLTPKGGNTFSYFNQDYNLDLRGPLFLPAFGQTKINLNYRLGKNVYEGYAWLNNTNQQLFTYSTAFYFSPVRLRRLFSLDAYFSRSTFDQFVDKNILASSLMRTSSLVSFTLHPPGRIKLSIPFSRNKNNRLGGRNNFRYLPFPVFHYSYAKNNTQDAFSPKPLFNQDRIEERYGVSWGLRGFSTRYDIKTSQNINLVTQEKQSMLRLREFYANLCIYENLKIFQSFIFSANHQVSETLYPGRSSSSQGNLSSSLTSKPFRFFGIHSTVYYNNYLSFQEEIKNWQMNNRLSLNSSRSLWERVHLRNILNYGFSTNSAGSAGQSVGENLSFYYSPLASLRLLGQTNQSYSWGSKSKGMGESYNARAEFSPWSIFNTFFDWRTEKTKDLIKKYVSGHTERAEVGFNTQVSPLKYFFNNNNRNHSSKGNNNRGNPNFFSNGNLLTLGFGFNTAQEKNLLDQKVTTTTGENYRLRSMPFNNYLTLEFEYNRVWSKTDGQPVSRQEYFLSNISSQAGFLFRGLVLSFNLYTPNLKQYNLQVLAIYNLGQSSFNLTYRIQQVTHAHSALSVIFTRRI